MNLSWEHHPDIRRATKIAAQYYDPETFDHAKRVAEYVKCDKFIPSSFRIDCICLALMHDLLEDTAYANEPKFECKFGIINEYHFDQALQLLTKPVDMDYIAYIKRFKEEINLVHQCAWWVKMADMKDHFAQTETLTDRLKEKYMAALPYLL